jgi:hypothetical protein
MSNREDPGEKTMSNIDQPCEPYSTDTGIADSYKEGRLHPRTIFSGNRELKRGIYMIWTIFVVLVVLWLLGIGTSYTMGGFIIAERKAMKRITRRDPKASHNRQGICD